MTEVKNIILICGGGGAEHDISLLTAEFFEKTLATLPNLKVHTVELCKDGSRKNKDGHAWELRKNKTLVISNSSGNELETYPLAAAIPCIHGYPGETGDIQSVFEMMELPYLGVNPEGSKICFNKITTKLWLNALGIPVVPFVFTNKPEVTSEISAFLKKHGNIFVKASNQGSSVGCYEVSNEKDLKQALNDALELSPFVLIEKSLRGSREFDVSVYEYEDEIHAPHPGEINLSDSWYTYDEKYSKDSQTKTDIIAKNIDKKIAKQMQDFSIDAFKRLNLRHLSGVDYFLTEDNQVYLSEINTFPGMTPISLFPQMMNQHGHNFNDFLSKLMLQLIG